jgi:ribosomal RNA-processing protein 36
VGEEREGRSERERGGEREDGNDDEDEDDDDDDDEGGGEEEDGEGGHNQGGGAPGPTAPKRSRGEPMEMPSNRAVSRFRNVLAVPKKVRRDPRFDPASGELKDTGFRHSYAFLDEYREKELRLVKKELGRCKDVDRKKELQGEVTRLQQALSEGARRDGIKAAHKEGMKGTQEAVAGGAKPFFPKRRDLKELDAVEQFKALEASGGAAAVEKALKKRREKMSKKDRTKLPPREGGRY